MNRYAGVCLILSLFQTGCLPVRPNFNPPPITQLQSRAIQTRTYQGLDHKAVIKTVFNGNYSPLKSFKKYLTGFLM